MTSSWRKAKLTEIPGSHEIPVPGRELTPEQEWEAVQRRDPAAAQRWADFAERFPENDRRAYAVRRYLGLSSFGCNAFSASAGNPLVIPHDESAYGQEELYLVVEGRARFVCDGEETQVGTGEVLFAAPDVHREAYALETPTTLFLVGGLPGRPYEPPAWSRDAR
ncbi:MAG: cupin domain-containing protein [Actinobacteria bacterium]|nr:MAG: cupin domain-containing protein [Actinomycetota bacterium]